MEFLHIYDTRGTYQYSAGILVRMQNQFFFSVSTIPPRPGDLRNTRSFFRGHEICIRLSNSGSFRWAGAGDVATRPKKRTCESRICPSLSRPFAAGPASSLFVVVQSVLDVIRIPGTTVVAYSSFFPPPFCFCRLVLKKNKSGTVLEEIILLAAACCVVAIKFSFFFAFSFSVKQSVCTRAGW